MSYLHIVTFHSDLFSENIFIYHLIIKREHKRRELYAKKSRKEKDRKKGIKVHMH